VSSEADAVTRIDLLAGSPAAEVVADPHPVSPGERLLTQMAERLLTVGAQGGQASAIESLGQIVTALIEVDALPPGNPVPSQLAVLCECLGRNDHGITVAGVPDVPESWADVLGINEGKGWRLVQPAGLPGQGPQAAQTAVAAAAVALPEIDGVRFAVAGLHSGWNRNVLYVVATGLPSPSPGLPGSRGPDTGFSWWVRDSAGRWHVALFSGSGPGTSGESRLDLSILPPLGPETSEIELVVTGRSAQARARLLLRWHVLGS
jgi:hypothetical protein